MPPRRRHSAQLNKRSHFVYLTQVSITSLRARSADPTRSARSSVQNMNLLYNWAGHEGGFVPCRRRVMVGLTVSPVPVMPARPLVSVAAECFAHRPLFLRPVAANAPLLFARWDFRELCHFGERPVRRRAPLPSPRGGRRGLGVDC